MRVQVFACITPQDALITEVISECGKSILSAELHLLVAISGLLSALV